MTPDEFRTARATLGLTQTQLAERLGLSRPAIARYEAGATIPKIVTILLNYLLREHHAMTMDLRPTEQQTREHLEKTLAFKGFAHAPLIGPRADWLQIRQTGNAYTLETFAVGAGAPTSRTYPTLGAIWDDLPADARRQVWGWRAEGPLTQHPTS